MNRLMLMAMGGYGDMGMMDAAAGGGGVIESLKAKLSFLPGWASILVIAVLVILAAMLVAERSSVRSSIPTRKSRAS